MTSSRYKNENNICGDRPIEVPEHIDKMSSGEIDKEFEKRFGKYLNEETEM